MDTRAKQAGLVSIMVTMVLMIVISLIVLGLAQVSRRDQREALDNQLSSQAFYAAETGVNDFARAIKAYVANHTDLTNADLNALNRSSCNPTPAQDSAAYSSLHVVNHNVLDQASAVAYTCVLVDATPTSLQYSSVGPTAQIIPINSFDASNNPKRVDNLVLDWQTTNAGLASPSSGCPDPGSIDQFPTTSTTAPQNWLYPSYPAKTPTCGLGILRIDLVPLSGPDADLSMQGLQASTMTAFLVPTKSDSVNSASVSYSSGANQYGSSNANQGAVVGAHCTDTSDPHGCSVTITGLTGSNYYLRISSIYETASLQVQGYYNGGVGGVTPTAASLGGAQVLIDSTGKAQDILRRIQVRLPVNSTVTPTSGDTFGTAIQSSLPLCKQFQTYPGSAADKSGNLNCALP